AVNTGRLQRMTLLLVRGEPNSPTLHDTHECRVACAKKVSFARTNARIVPLTRPGRSMSCYGVSLLTGAGGLLIGALRRFVAAGHNRRFAARGAGVLGFSATVRRGFGAAGGRTFPAQAADARHMRSVGADAFAAF